MAAIDFSGIGRKMARRLTTFDFIEKARKAHGDRYDYSKVEYINNKSKIEIICKEHGSFWQAPNNHTALLQGCPNCQKGKYDKKSFIRNILHDKIKTDYCKNNKIGLLRIPYWDFNIINNLLQERL